MNVQVIAGPAGLLIRASPILSGARHDAGAAEHAIPAAQSAAGITTFADTAYCGVGSTIHAPFRKVRSSPCYATLLVTAIQVLILNS